MAYCAVSPFAIMPCRAIGRTEALRLGGMLAPTLRDFTLAMAASSAGAADLAEAGRLTACRERAGRLDQYGEDWFDAAPPGGCVALLARALVDIAALARDYRLVARGEAFRLDQAARSTRRRGARP